MANRLIHVVIGERGVLHIRLDGERWQGRFVSRTAALHVGDAVGVRIERSVAGAPFAAHGRAVVVRGRITELFPEVPGWAPSSACAGVRFAATIDAAEHADPDEETQPQPPAPRASATAPDELATLEQSWA